MKQKNTSSKTSILKSIGPGFLLAGAAIGVSHLVQATRAGADYGFILIWVLIIACISKYPFLEFGPRLAAGTGNHLITGYKKLGKFPYWIYILITIGNMFIIQAAVTIVTAGLAERLFNFGWSPFLWSGIILIACIALLLIGKYPGLDKSMKVIVTLLTFATLAAVIMAFGAGTVNDALTTESPSLWTTASLGFIIAFMGWMPIPLDASVWHSIWTKEKAVQNKQKISVKGAFADFNVGYLSAAFIGLLFFLLGVLVMFGSGTSFSSNSVEFSSQLVELYGKTLGEWSKPLISVAAFVTMLSTVLTVTDAYPRVISELKNPEKEKPEDKKEKWKIYRISIFIIPVLSLSILYFLSGSFTILVDFAAGLSFLSAPFLAWFNYKLVTGKQMPEKHRPGKNYRVFSLICFALLVVFNFVYLYYTFLS
ncbi:NRAMP family divalent metal transporter [Salegentibacter mishustinae]|uniref:Permease n=1 Tax=Salegentibacter mishustinae TaxID=270918 RepID=A0A0Q9Z825_9FLAO|nr:divalent metal cation transporter [Salegentibacter mishustinae]KRG29115.1 permease [Salegentibacter mishustinae]PNW21832.1 permease [Salegentibacter mishustinae]PZX65180.1 Mn2+/Fe2+ NRAMP family transporter [Salegentibacter mishustinae]GGW86838.1 membrane protein [Salegentibacter mishustinae]